MKTITYEGKPYEYTYTSLDLARISMAAAKEDTVMIFEHCANLITTKLSGEPEEIAMLRFKLAPQIMNVIMAELSGTKNAPAPSSTEKP